MINFKNGQLVNGAYVEIDGKQYQVHMPEYSGDTPLSAENLNKLQSDLQEGIIKTAKGTVLYENNIGTNGKVSFNESIEAGDIIEIVYCRRRLAGTSIYKSSGRIPYIEGMEISLDINYFDNLENQQNIAKSIIVNSQEIISKGENSWGNAMDFVKSNTIYITKVIRYKDWEV